MRATAAELNKIATHLSPIDKAIVEDAARRIGSVNKPHDLEARETAARLFEEWWAADVAAYSAPMGTTDEEFARLKTRAEKAKHDYQAQDLRVMFEDGVVERCALTDVPLLVADEISLVLSSAIGAESEEQDEQLPMFPEMAPA
jgi:hypothetical protein